MRLSNFNSLFYIVLLLLISNDGCKNVSEATNPEENVSLKVKTNTNNDRSNQQEQTISSMAKQSDIKNTRKQNGLNEAKKESLPTSVASKSPTSKVTNVPKSSPSKKKESSSSSLASSTATSKAHDRVADSGTNQGNKALSPAPLVPASHTPKTHKNDSTSLRIAFCLTGQLARLELSSKISNIFIPNARVGHLPHVFVLLDHDLGDVKQTYWKYNYNKTVFGAYSRQDLKAFIDSSTDQAGVLHAVRSRVKLELPSRYRFTPTHGVIPVRDKEYSGHDGPKDNFESASSRFQNNMRWMNGLRDCVRWVMDTEQQQGWHYDLVVRLRDDTYALDKWMLDKSYMNSLTSSSSGSFKGINDHNFVVDRKWADVLFRGFTEDYYFNSTLEKVMWGNPENRILTMADSYAIPVKGKNICQQPLIPLRGLVNDSFWYLHPLYIRHFQSDCIRLDEHAVPRAGANSEGYEAQYEDNPKPTCCKESWYRLMDQRAVAALPPLHKRRQLPPGVGPPKKLHSDDDLYEPPEYRV